MVNPVYMTPERKRRRLCRRPLGLQVNPDMTFALRRPAHVDVDSGAISRVQHVAWKGRHTISFQFTSLGAYKSTFTSVLRHF